MFGLCDRESFRLQKPERSIFPHNFSAHIRVSLKLLELLGIRTTLTTLTVDMGLSRTRSFSGRMLLMASAVWLVAVTLCSTGAMSMEGPAEPRHTVAESHTDHSHDSSHHGDKSDHSCGCESFKSFPAPAVTLAKASTPATSFVLYTIPVDEFTAVSAGSVITTQNTGPPGRLAFDELILQRCRLSHAPPSVV